MPHMAPHVAAGMCGMLVVAGLTIANGLLEHVSGTGLSPTWLLLLLLPGAVSSHLSRRHVSSKESSLHDLPLQGLRAGIVTAHFAAPLLVALLIAGAATIDWARYSTQVGSEVATAVHNAALPATLLLSVVAVILAYGGCALAGLLGGTLYMLAFGYHKRLKH